MTAPRPARLRHQAAAFSVPLFILFSIPAAAKQPVHALRKILVEAGTHSTQAQTQQPDHLLSQVFNSRCQLLANPQQQTSFLAGTVGETLKLAVHAMTCPLVDTPPALTCAWSITPSTRLNAPSCGMVGDRFSNGQGSWQNWRGSLEVPLPDRTGIYDLAMTCVIHADDTFTEKVTYPLFVTYAEPLAAIGPPSEAMYEKACCWGAGFARGDREEIVLKGLLHGLYRFGQSHWRYGYARQAEEIHLFHGRDGIFPVFGEPLNCGSAGRCKCYWEDLAAGIRCDFGDCFTFADLFQGISATTGILTLSQCETCIFGGTHQYGFLITPDPPSFDAAFPRDVVCKDGATCPTTYYFGKHNLVLKPPLYYDPTFDNIYANPADAVDNVIAYKVRKTQGGQKLYTLTTDTTTVQQILPSFYGAWSFYRYLPTTTGRRAIRLTITGTSRSVSFQNEASFEKVPSRERSDLYRSLAVEIEVTPDTAGTYALYGGLFKGKELITQRPDWSTSAATVTIFQAQANEVVKARLEFSGEDIYRAQKSGPFVVHPYVIDEDGVAHTAAPVHTAAYSHKSFGESAARLGTVTPSWLDEDGTRSLQVDVAVQVRVPKPLAVQLELAQDGRALAFASTSCADACQLETNKPDGHAVSLTLQAPLIASLDTSSSAAPLTLTVGLFERTPHLRNLDGWAYADLPTPDTTKMENLPPRNGGTKSRP